MKKGQKFETLDEALDMLCRQYEKDGLDIKTFLEKEDGDRSLQDLARFLDIDQLLDLNNPVLREEVIQQAESLIRSRLNQPESAENISGE